MEYVYMASPKGQDCSCSLDGRDGTVHFLPPFNQRDVSQSGAFVCSMCAREGSQLFTWSVLRWLVSMSSISKQIQWLVYMFQRNMSVRAWVRICKLGEVLPFLHVLSSAHKPWTTCHRWFSGVMEMVTILCVIAPPTLLEHSYVTANAKPLRIRKHRPCKLHLLECW